MNGIAGTMKRNSMKSAPTYNKYTTQTRSAPTTGHIPGIPTRSRARRTSAGRKTV